MFAFSMTLGLSIAMIFWFCINHCKLTAFHQHGPSGILLADLQIGDWLGGLLYSAGQQANEAVQDQLSALSFSRFIFLFFFTYVV
jgi:hypothetical protein